MLITIEDLLSDEYQYIVYLNDKLICTCVGASEEEGWVDIPDIAAMAPLDLENNSDLNEPDPWEEPPIKRLFGAVKIKQLKN